MNRLFVFAVTIVMLAGCQWPYEGEAGSPGDSDVNSKPTVLSNIMGTLRYQDRIYSNTGFVQSQQPYKAIRGVAIELLNDKNETVSTAVSDENGMVTLADIPQGDYTLRVTAQVTQASGAVVSIRDMDANLYAIEQSISVSPSQLDFEFLATIEDNIAGIFNMLDVFSLAYDFVDTLNLNALQVNDLNVYWQWRRSQGSYNCRGNSHQCTQGAGIYVLSDPILSGDTDEFDDDVLLHEFAHHLETSFNMLDSNGGAHSFTNYQLDLRLAWSEGMASAFAISFKKWLRATKPSLLSVPNTLGTDLTNYYIDTITDRTSLSVDLLSANSIFFRYATNEAAVASTILRLQNYNGINTTWSLLFNGLTENSHADTLEAFWDAQVGSLQPSSTELKAWEDDIEVKKIFYALDNAEQNDSINSAQPLLIGTSQFHTFYRNYYTVDEDWFTLSVEAGSTYTVSTFDLINGADTVLELFDTHKQKIASNDDEFDCELQTGQCNPLHNGINFSSAITFTASSDGTVFLRASTSDVVYADPVNYGYIGRYGGYSILAVQEP